MTPANSLLSRARNYMQNRAGRTALTIAPLAALSLASANSARADTAVFDPGAIVTYGPDSNDIYQYNGSGGSISGASLGMNSQGATGATYSGSASFNDFEGGFAGVMGSIQMFSIQGTGSGSIGKANAQAQISYDFTLSTNEGFIETSFVKPAISEFSGPMVTGGTLDLSVTTDTGTFPMVVNLDDSGTYTGTVDIPITGTTLLSYSAVLTASYTIAPTGDNFDAGITATVPMATSIDFTEVPEPSTWVILATGVGVGLQLMRVRQRRAKAAPTVV